MWSLHGLARAVSCGASRPARDDDHDPATPAPARRTLAPAPGMTCRPATELRVGRQDLPTRLGPLGLVQLISVVRVHDGRPFVGEVFAVSPRRRTALPVMDTPPAGFLVPTPHGPFG